jgi:putative oxidoreductase
MKFLSWFRPCRHTAATSAALFALRVVCGAAFMFHGWSKIANPFGWMGPTATMPGILQSLAALSEFGGGLAWILGLLTPLASFGIACTMVVAVYMHAIVMGDPFVGRAGSYELASIFLTVSLLFLAAGPGKFSLDRAIFGERSS